MTTQTRPTTATDRAARVRAGAQRIRLNALHMGEVQGQGYIGQALGAADVLAAVYLDQLRHRPADPHWDERDRFLLSTGHYAIALYAALAEAGILPREELDTYGSDDSRLPMSGWPATRPEWRSPVGRSVTGSPSRWAWPWVCVTAAATPGCSTSSPTVSSTRARPGRRR